MPALTEGPESLSAFGDKSRCPTDAELQRALGSAALAWTDLVAHIQQAYPPAIAEWNFSGTKYGWSLRLKKPDRVILYLIPQTRHFLVGIALGAKAVAAAQNADLPDSVLEAIAAAPRYAEGTGLRLPVSHQSQLPPIETLTSLKMARR